MSKPVYSEEIDFVEYIKILSKYKWVIIFCMVMGLIAAFVYNERAQNIYTAKVTFFLPGQAAASSSYSQLLGLPSASAGFDSYITAFVMSNRIKQYVAKDMRKYFSTLTTQEILATLNLGGGLTIGKDETGMFNLEFQSPNPKLISSVLDSYLKNLIRMNSQFEISSQRQVITVLDQPEISKKPIKPTKNKNLVIGFVGGLMLGIVVAFIINLFSSRRTYS